MKLPLTARSLRKRLLSGGAWSLGGKVFAALTTIVVNAILTRILDPTEVAAYFIAISIIVFAAVLGTSGLDRAVVRFIAQYVGTDDVSNVRRTLHIGVTIGAAGSLAVAVLFFAVKVPLLDNLFHSPLLLGASVSLTLWICLATLQRLLAEVFRGFHDIRFAVLIGGIGTKGSGILNGLLLLIGVGVLWRFDGVNLPTVITLAALSSLFLVALGSLRLFRIVKTLPEERRDAPPREARRVTAPTILVVALPLLVSTLMQTIRLQVDIWLLGGLRPGEEVAIYGATLRLVALVTTPLLIFGSVMSPIISELYAKNSLRQLERVLRSTATVVGIPSFLMLLVLGIWGRPILSFIYGGFYAQGAPILIILSIGQLVGVWAGACGLVLAMTGHERENMIITIAAASWAVVFGLLLTRSYGMTGMAVANVSAFLLYNLLMVLTARRKLGIWTLIYFHPRSYRELIASAQARRKQDPPRPKTEA